LRVGESADEAAKQLRQAVVGGKQKIRPEADFKGRISPDKAEND